MDIIFNLVHLCVSCLMSPNPTPASVFCIYSEWSLYVHVCICLLPLKHLNYTMVAVHEDKLRDKLQKKMPLPVYWEFTHEAEDLQRLDHLYTVHYPDPEGKGEHRRSFGGDVIQGTQGSCSTPSIVCMTLQHRYSHM